VNEVLVTHGGAPTPSRILAFPAFPRVVGAKEVGELNLVKGEGEGYINHCKEPDEGKRRADHFPPSIVAPPLDMPIPKTVEQVINDPAYGPQWRNALAKMLTGFDNKGCTEVVDQMAFMKPILRLQPIFKIKCHVDGTFDKFKVRLVVGEHRAVMTYVDDITFTTDSESIRAEVFAAINAQVTIEDRGVRDTEEPSHWPKTKSSKTNPLPANKVGESE
jgi:hypothetical protein